MRRWLRSSVAVWLPSEFTEPFRYLQGVVALSFLFQSLLTLGLPLIAVPLLIHLINLRRHRRVQWAAMEFLLESQKRNKKWIFLRQLLLLLMRTAAIALVVMMLAGPILQFQWGRLFGKGTTHHLILLDDSYSMSDHWETSSAFAEAKRVVTELLDQATQQPGNQKLTLLRFSQANQLTAGAEVAELERPLDRETYDDVSAMLQKLAVTETDVGPREALQAALRLPEPTEDETRIAYLVSDFRRQQWQGETETRDLLRQLRDQATQLHLIQCVEQSRPNLAITKLAPESGIRAASVETWMQVTVTNYGDVAADSVVVTVLQDTQKLPAVQFDTIPPGESSTRRFRVTFSAAGAHQLQASLASDAIELDSVRYFACDIPNEFPVLLVDGSREGDDGYYLRTALNPGGNSRPGWNPQVQRTEFLRQHERLAEFAAIYLLDVPRLDDSEVQALEQYVSEGGGLGIFLGQQVQRPFYNERLYRDGEGLLPAPLGVPTQMLAVADEETADVEVGSHPLFRIFAGQRNSFLALVNVNFYYALDPQWRAPEDGKTQVLANLRNGAPFVLEKEFGEGRVVVQLTKLSPRKTDLGSWTNWSLNPVFPVYANELVGYLSSSRRETQLLEVGSDLAFELPEVDYAPEVEIRTPLSKGGEARTVTPRVDEGEYLVEAGKALLSGVWEFVLQSREDELERKLVAVNVPTQEGNLQHLDRQQLAQNLQGIDYEFSLASQRSTGEASFAGYRLGDTFLYLLIGLLLAEQWLAYKTSYHADVISV